MIPTASCASPSARPHFRASRLAEPAGPPDQVVDRLLHISFNQLKETNEKLVTDREDIFFGAEFSACAGTLNRVTTRGTSRSDASAASTAFHAAL